jgi:hypothetical protein
MEKGSATITVSWGYGPHSIELSARDWRSIKSGQPTKIRGEGCNYEGEFFWDYWQYSGGLDGSLIVEYGEGGGTGFVGKLSDAEIEEA